MFILLMTTLSKAARHPAVASSGSQALAVHFFKAQRSTAKRAVCVYSLPLNNTVDGLTSYYFITSTYEGILFIAFNRKLIMLLTVKTGSQSQNDFNFLQSNQSHG